MTAAVSGMPVQLSELRSPSWTDSYSVAPEGGVLVRPDGYVAARWPTTPSFPHSAVADALAAILR